MHPPLWELAAHRREQWVVWATEREVFSLRVDLDEEWVSGLGLSTSKLLIQQQRKGVTDLPLQELFRQVYPCRGREGLSKGVNMSVWASLRGVFWKEEPVVEKKTEVQLEDDEGFDIFRVRVDAVGACDACEGLVTEGETHVLVIQTGSGKEKKTQLLCEFHEGEVLMALLRAYLRRIKGGDNIGFGGPIRKTQIEMHYPLPSEGKFPPPLVDPRTTLLP